MEEPQETEVQKEEQAQAEGREPLFVNETMNDIENNLTVSMAVTKKMRWVFFALGVASIVLGAVILALDLTVLKDDGDFFIDVFLITLGIFLSILSLCYKQILRKALIKNMQGKESRVHFEFFDDGYEIRAVDNVSSQSVTTGNYLGLTQCVELKDYWLLYYNKAAFYIVAKNGLLKGDEASFSAFLTGKLGSSYKPVKKK